MVKLVILYAALIWGIIALIICIAITFFEEQSYSFIERIGKKLTW
jgi:flagellar biosynthesis protein FliQ